ncbi:6980_t:CDS:2, partial [Paraglomus brasilianum]
TLAQNQCINVPKLKLFVEIQRPSGTITLLPQNIIKKLPYLEKPSLIDYVLNRHSVLLTLTPVGYMAIPINEDELRDAIRDVLVAVEKLHKMNVVHRDIRRDNIVRLLDGSWMLIDFEEVARIGDSRTAFSVAAPEYKGGQDFCNTAGDIWMVGNLLNDSRICDHIHIFPSAQQFRDKLTHENPNKRPTADEALRHEWLIMPTS